MSPCKLDFSMCRPPPCLLVQNIFFYKAWIMLCVQAVAWHSQLLCQALGTCSVKRGLWPVWLRACAGSRGPDTGESFLFIKKHEQHWSALIVFLCHVLPARLFPLSPHPCSYLCVSPVLPHASVSCSWLSRYVEYVAAQTFLRVILMGSPGDFRVCLLLDAVYSDGLRQSKLTLLIRTWPSPVLCK